MSHWFRRTKDARPAAQPPRDQRRFKRLPPRVDPRDLRTSQPVSPPRDAEGGRDTDRDFVIRYGDPFED